VKGVVENLDNSSVVLLNFSVYLSDMGDSKWLWINIATMYENVCGNSVGKKS
jgi:hypothetical protein